LESNELAWPNAVGSSGSVSSHAAKELTMAKKLFVVGMLLALGCGAQDQQTDSGDGVFDDGADEEQAPNGDDIGTLEQRLAIVFTDGFGILEFVGDRCQLPTWPQRCLIPLSRNRKVFNAIATDASASVATRNLSTSAVNAVIAKVNSVGHTWSTTTSAVNNNITIELKQLPANNISFLRGIGTIDHLPQGELNQFKTCHIQIDPDFIAGKTSAFIDNAMRRSLYSCAGLGRGGNGLMSGSLPNSFVDITAQELGFLQQFNP